MNPSRGLLVIVLGAWGCAGTETGNPLKKSELGFSATSSDKGAISVDGESALGVDQILMSSAFGTLPCDEGGEHTTSETAVLDLIDGEPRLEAPEPPERICGIQLLLSPAKQGPELLLERTFVMGGERSDSVPFLVLGSNQRTLTFRAEGTAGFSPESLLLSLDLAVWINGNDLSDAPLTEGSIVISAATTPELAGTFEEHLGAAMALYLDVDGDGTVNAEVDTLLAIGE